MRAGERSEEFFARSLAQRTPGTDPSHNTGHGRERILRVEVVAWSEITASGDFFLEVRARVVNVILGALGSYVNSFISGDLGSGSYPDRQGGLFPPVRPCA